MDRFRHRRLGWGRAGQRGSHLVSHIFELSLVLGFILICEFHSARWSRYASVSNALPASRAGRTTANAGWYAIPSARGASSSRCDAAEFPIPAGWVPAAADESDWAAGSPWWVSGGAAWGR